MSVFVRSEHEQKYDRQTRIWGAHGQLAIETSHICVLGSSATASEALKSLILPNVQHFTVVDDKLVDDHDLETNFFVDSEDRGKPRAEAVVRHLSELNPDAKGNFVVKNPGQAFKDNPEFFRTFQLVIACQMTDADVLPLAEFLYASNIPFMNVKSYGLVGSLRIAVPELLVVETHYENDRIDLFLHPDQTAHFPELAAYCNSFNIDTEETHIHSHIPYVAILVKLAERWRANHDGKMPTGYQEQKAFKEFIIESSLDFGQEENFEEAHKFAHRVYQKRELDDEVKEVFEHPHCNNLTPNSPNFWVMARAVRDFYQNEGHGMLPASSDIPDMTTTSESFVALKDIFSRKAAADLGAVTARVQQLLVGLGKPASAVPANEIEYFVKNIRGIRQITFRSLAEEHNPASFAAATINEIIEEEEFHEDPDAPVPPKDVYWYIALRAAEQFHAQFGRYPGTGAVADLNQEKDALGAAARAFMDQYGISGAIGDDVLQETVRFGASELHTVASVLGAVAAQEGLKIILRQFIPVNNTFIYNGIHGKQLALQL